MLGHFLGQLKTLLTGPELPAAPDISVLWDNGYFIEQLRPLLAAGSVDFLIALVAAMSDRSRLPDLELFPEWREQPAIPLDTPWPDIIPKAVTDGGRL